MKTILLSNSAIPVFVDDEDFPVLSRIAWYLSDHGYVKHEPIYMHQLVMGMRGHPIDHKDRNKLNNQKENLRPTTKQRNLFNRPKQKNNKGRYKGVHFRKHLKVRPWQSTISKTENGVKRNYFQGYFSTAKEAALAYDKKAKELFGEFAFLNFP